MVKNQQYVNIHCHGLFGVDDGAKDFEQACEMLKLSHKEGIRVIVFTPHYHEGKCEPDIRTIEDNFRTLKEYAGEMYPDMDLLLGSEVYYIGSDSVAAVSDGRAMTLTGTRYVLVEFSTGIKKTELTNAIIEYRSAGYRPIVAHLERYKNIYKDRAAVNTIIRLGAYIQVNTRSLKGRRRLLPWRRDSKYRTLVELINAGMVHFIADDSHGTGSRKPYYGSLVRRIRRRVDSDELDKILYVNPIRLLEDETI